MLDIKDMLKIESGERDDAAMQNAINDGIAWKLQGSFGRAMMAAIEEGSVMLGREPKSDYWGNRIPSRDEVRPGTKGSRQYVAARMGEDHAAEMEKI